MVDGGGGGGCFVLGATYTNVREREMANNNIGNVIIVVWWL